MPGGRICDGLLVPEKASIWRPTEPTYPAWIESCGSQRILHHQVESLGVGRLVVELHTAKLQSIAAYARGSEADPLQSVFQRAIRAIGENGGSYAADCLHWKSPETAVRIQRDSCNQDWDRRPGFRMPRRRSHIPRGQRVSGSPGTTLRISGQNWSFAICRGRSHIDWYRPTEFRLSPGPG